MNESVFFTSLGKRVALYNPMPKTASSPAKNLIAISTHTLTLEVGFLELFRGNRENLQLKMEVRC